MNEFVDYQKKINLLIARKSILSEQLNEKRELLNFFTQRYENSIKARLVLQDKAQKLQKKVEHCLGSLVTMALASIFNDPYTCIVEFVKKRNKTECEIWLEKHGERMKALDSSGGGISDVASFALRVAFLSMTKNARNTIICDEPFKFVSNDNIPRCCEMVKMLSDERNLQFIIVTHIRELIRVADKVFEL
jgi:DNA repair exonuclease SbcCD ATPase subunit